MDKKNLAYRFAEIPWVIQTLILNKCGLLSEDMKDKRYIEFIDKIIEKAEKLNCLNKFEAEIYEYHKDLSRDKSKDIIKIKREEDGTIDVEVIENMNALELFNVTKDVVAIVTQLMLRDLDEVKYHKNKRALKEILCQAVDEGYVS